MQELAPALSHRNVQSDKPEANQSWRAMAFEVLRVANVEAGFACLREAKHTPSGESVFIRSIETT